MTVVAEKADGLVVEGLGLDRELGTLFADVSLTTAASGLYAVCGMSGADRTSLLLTLAGRLAPSRGSVSLFGVAKRATIRENCSIAGFATIDDLDETVTVRAILVEQIRWLTPWWKPAPRPSDAELTQMLTPAFGHLPIPDPRSLIIELSDLDDLLLRIALALSMGRRCLIVDDIEQVRRAEHLPELVARLRALAERRLVVVGAVNRPDGVPPSRVFTFGR